MDYSSRFFFSWPRNSATEKPYWKVAPSTLKKECDLDLILKQSPDNIKTDTSVLIDYALLVPTLYLSEALVRDYRLKKALMKLLDHVITHEARTGQANLIGWLEKTKFSHTQEIKKLLTTTPLGNPAWGLFGDNREASKDLIRDLESFIAKVSSHEPRSMKSLVSEFILQHPQYGIVKEYDEKAWTTFHPSSRWMEVGAIVTDLMMLQTAATPKSVKQRLLDGVEKPTKDEFPIHRPDSVLYRVALTTLLISSAEVERPVWDEMLSLYESRTLTNFLAFAPLLLQPFVDSDLNIPAPNINTLATLMGDFTGATGTFMGEITRAKTEIRWNELGLTVGKLCEKVGKMPNVSESTPSQESDLSPKLNSTTRICGDACEKPTIGEDRGWVIIKDDILNDRWNINLTDINDSIINDKIRFNNFPVVRKSLVFTSSTSRIRLNQWRLAQAKQKTVCRLLGEKNVWFNPRTTTQELATNKVTVFPFLTYTFRCEKKSAANLRKYLMKDRGLSEVRAASEAEAKTKTCIGSETTEDSRNVVSKNMQTAGNLVSDSTGAPPKTTPDIVPASPRVASMAVRNIPLDELSQAVTTDCPPDDGISQFFIAETYQGDRNKKECISKIRQQRVLDLKTERKEQEAYRAVASLTNEDLKTTIDQRFERFKTIERSKMTWNEKVTVCGELEIALAELVQRELGLDCPNLVGIKTQAEVLASGQRPLHYRYRLGDEEAIAVEAWYSENPEDDVVLAPPATRAIRRIKVALTFMFLLKHLKRECKEWSFTDLWHYDIFKKYPLSEKDKHAVYSLIPHLYWVYELEHPDLFRVRIPDMQTPLFVPTARVSRFEKSPDGLLLFPFEDDDDEDEDNTNCLPSDVSDSYLPDLIPGIKISSLSLCSHTDWKPEMILENVTSFFDQPYSLDLHPNKTQYIRLYVKEAVNTLVKRLSNRNLSDSLSDISPIKTQMTPDFVWSIFETMKKNLKHWYSQFVTSFNDRWQMLGDEWVSFVDVNEKEIDVRYV